MVTQSNDRDISASNLMVTTPMHFSNMQHNHWKKKNVYKYGVHVDTFNYLNDSFSFHRNKRNVCSNPVLFSTILKC